MNPKTVAKATDNWLPRAVDALKHVGYFVLEGVLNDQMIKSTRQALIHTQEIISEEIGRVKLERADEIGVLRLMMKYEPHFLELLSVPEMLAVVDVFLTPTAVLHTHKTASCCLHSLSERHREFSKICAIKIFHASFTVTSRQ